MKKKITVASALILVLFAILLTFQITFHFVGKEYQAKVDTLTKTQSDFSLLAQADSLIRGNYKGVIEEETLENALLQGYITALGDPYARYLTEEEYAVYQQSISGSGYGVGLRLAYDAATAETFVYNILAESPAAASGIQKGDVLYRIGDALVSDLGFYGAAAALSEQSEAQVKITVRREVAARQLELEFTLARQIVHVPSVTCEMVAGNIGYVQVFSFDSSTSEEFSQALAHLTALGAKALVFDVRGNTGNSLDAALSVLDQLLPEGNLVRITDRLGKETLVLSTDIASVSLPMAVLINENTAGASELFAATLRDFNAAVLVGKTSYGKGSNQKVFELDQGGALIFTDRTFMPPISDSFDKKGIAVDIECDITGSSHYLLSHEEDGQLQRALQALADKISE